MRITDLITQTDIVPFIVDISYKFGTIHVSYFERFGICQLVFKEDKFPHEGKIVNTPIRVYLGCSETYSTGNSYYTPILFENLKEFLNTQDVDIRKLRIFLDPEKLCGDGENVISLPTAKQEDLTEP